MANAAAEWSRLKDMTGKAPPSMGTLKRLGTIHDLRGTLEGGDEALTFPNSHGSGSGGDENERGADEKRSSSVSPTPALMRLALLAHANRAKLAESVTPVSTPPLKPTPAPLAAPLLIPLTVTPPDSLPHTAFTTPGRPGSGTATRFQKDPSNHKVDPEGRGKSGRRSRGSSRRRKQRAPLFESPEREWERNLAIDSGALMQARAQSPLRKNRADSPERPVSRSSKNQFGFRSEELKSADRLGKVFREWDLQYGNEAPIASIHFPPISQAE